MTLQEHHSWLTSDLQTHSHEHVHMKENKENVVPRNPLPATSEPTSCDFGTHFLPFGAHFLPLCSLLLVSIVPVVVFLLPKCLPRGWKIIYSLALNMSPSINPLHSCGTGTVGGFSPLHCPGTSATHLSSPSEAIKSYQIRIRHVTCGIFCGFCFLTSCSLGFHRRHMLPPLPQQI